MKFNFLRQYYETIMVIIQERPKYEIPIEMYQFLMLVSYLQMFVYMLPTNYSSRLSDEKIKSVTKLMKVISVSNLLVMQENDSESALIYLVASLFMLCYFIYSSFMTLVKHFWKAFYDNYQGSFTFINQTLHLYFSLFMSVFFTIFVELNSSIIFCTERSLLSAYRASTEAEKASCSIPFGWQCLGVLGLILTLVTAFIACYFFRNFEFIEHNKIKRRQNMLFIGIILAKFTLTLMFFSMLDSDEYGKHVLSQVIGALSIIDFFMNIPYSDQQLNKFYLFVISWYYTLIIVGHAWTFTSLVDDQEVFYFALIVGVPFHCLMQAICNTRMEKIMLMPVKSNFQPEKLDVFLEQFARLAFLSSTEEEAKVELIKVYKSHLQLCSNSECPCRQIEDSIMKTILAQQLQQQQQQQQGKPIAVGTVGKKMDDKTIQKQRSANFEDKLLQRAMTTGQLGQQKLRETESVSWGNELQPEAVLSIIDAIFKFYLQQPILSRDQQEYEHLSLKYITFMIKYLKNYTRANYELKLLQFQRVDFSHYFKIIARFISQEIQKVISTMNIELEAQRKEEITVEQIVEVENICQKYMPKIVASMQAKAKMWTSLQAGYSNMNGFQDEVLILMKSILELRTTFLNDSMVLDKHNHISQSLQFQKLNMIFNLFVLNDRIRASELEYLVHDLRKRDSLKPPDILSNENMIRENISNITISIAQSLGKITSKKNEKTAAFFGYSEQDFTKIIRINELMPPLFARTHDNIIKQFVQRGQSDIIKQSKIVFIRNKKGFIQPTKLYLDFAFINEFDFQVQGTFLKTKQAYDYLLFDRSGQVQGISQRLATHLVSLQNAGSHDIPTGDTFMSNLHAMILVPNIVKQIFNRRDMIQSNNRSDGDTLVQDRKGSIILKLWQFKELKKFISYIQRRNNNKSSNSNQSLRKTNNSSVSGASSNTFDTLDLLSEDSQRMYKSYHESDLNSNGGSQAVSSDRKGNIKLTTLASKSAASSNYENIQEKFRLRFTYTLSYHYISSSCSSDNDLYFQVRMNDLNVLRIKQKQRNNFLTNICTYVLSTTYIGQLDKSLQIKQTEGQNVLPGVHSMVNSGVDNELNQWLFTNEDIPQKLLKLAAYNESNPQMNFDEDEEENIKQKKDRSKKRGNNAVHSSSSIGSESMGESNDDIDGVTMKLLCKQRKVIDNYDACKYEELDQVLLQYNINEEKIAQIDSSYKIKRIIQKKSLSGAFGRALEKALLEALYEQQEERLQFINSQADCTVLQAEATFRGMDILQQNMTNVIQQGNQAPAYLGGVGSLRSSIKYTDPSRTISRQKEDDSYLNSTIDKLLPQRLNQIEEEAMYSNNALLNNYQDESILKNLIDKSNTTDVSIKPNDNHRDSQAIELTNIPLNENNPTDIDDQINTRIVTTISFTIPDVKKQTNKLDKQRSNLFQSQHGLNLMNSQSLPSPQKATQLINSMMKDSTVLKSSQGKQGQEQNEDLSGARNKSNLTNQDGGEEDDQFSGNKQHDMMLALMNSKGLVNQNEGKDNSIQSSSKSSTSYGGIFLKEIIVSKKLPQHSYQYSVLLMLFIVAFFSLNLTNLLIIQSDMKSFSDNVIILRQPRKFLRAYARCLFGYLIESEIYIGILNDSDGSRSTISKNYLKYCFTEYYTLVSTFGKDMMEYIQKQQIQSGDISRDLTVYQNQQLFKQTVDLSIMYNYHFNFLIGIQNAQTEFRRIDSYLYLRVNYFQFSNDVLSFGLFLVNTVISTIQNLVQKFTVIAVAAIVGMIVISSLALPILRFVNLYEEKILMIVSRINFDHSQIEKLKLNVCQQLINLNTNEWLRYNYQDIFCMRFNQFNPDVVNNSYEQVQKLSVQTAAQGKQSAITGGQVMKQIALSAFKQKKKAKSTIKEKPIVSKLAKVEENEDQLANQQAKSIKLRLNEQQSSHQEYANNLKKSINKNYILQSKIINQRLSIFRRFIPLMILTICNSIYFLIIIVYIRSNEALLKSPVTLNLKSIQYHIGNINLKVSCELLAFNSQLEEKKFTKLVSTNDLQNYSDIMNDMLDLLQQRGSEVTEIVYGDNSFPSDKIDTLKTIQEGMVCKLLSQFACNQTAVGNKYGINFMLEQKKRVINTYNTVIRTVDTEFFLVQEYANSVDHLEVFIKSFLIEDEVQDISSSTCNQSIGVISTQVQTFLQQYLLYYGNIFGVAITIICYLNWKQLYHRMQLMNLFLTFIPDEKLLEEVTLQMLKSLRRM